MTNMRKINRYCSCEIHNIDEEGFANCKGLVALHDVFTRLHLCILYYISNCFHGALSLPDLCLNQASWNRFRFRFRASGVDSDSDSDSTSHWQSGVDSDSDSSFVLAKRNWFRFRLQRPQKSIILIPESIPFLTFCNVFKIIFHYNANAMIMIY